MAVESLFQNLDYGCDLLTVHEAQCPRCGVAIGEGPYVIDTSLVKFGTVRVYHRGCAELEMCAGNLEVPWEMKAGHTHPHAHGKPVRQRA